MVYDRYGEVMVYNEPVYDLLMMPRQVKTFDTLELCRILDVTLTDLEEGIRKAKKYSLRKTSPVIRNIPAGRNALMQEKLFKYPGFSIQTRTQRKYPRGIAPHVLGYLGEVDQKDLTSDPYYNLGDYIGQAGLEKFYEKQLRGVKGVHHLLVDVYNRVQGSYEEGRYDTLPKTGMNLTCTLDSDLQAYAEYLMNGKKGSIVVIEPSTGEILTLLSSPAYDPNLLSGRERSNNYNIMKVNPQEPFFNRATMSRYAPGSIFKIIQALVGLQLEVITPYSSFECNKELMGCHEHPRATNIKLAIQYSCNPYFFQVYRRIIMKGESRNIFIDSEIGLQAWQQMVMSFGLGQVMETDLPGIRAGFIPGVDFYDKWYGDNRWAFSTIYSNCTGQGEVETVPIQIANLAATIANRGYYFVPHFIKEMEGVDGVDNVFRQKRYSDVNSSYFELIVDAMQDVVYEPGGTGSRARVPRVVVCGKTGTVENTHGEDHSGFFAFAPRENPQIAIAVYVENAGSGGIWAAAITSLMIEKYLTGTITQKEKERMVLEFELEE